jgi:hypothetical protein
MLPVHVKRNAQGSASAVLCCTCFSEISHTRRQLWRRVEAPTLLPYRASVSEVANQINIVTIQEIGRRVLAGDQFAFESAYDAEAACLFYLEVSRRIT